MPVPMEVRFGGVASHPQFDILIVPAKAFSLKSPRTLTYPPDPLYKIHLPAQQPTYHGHSAARGRADVHSLDGWTGEEIAVSCQLWQDQKPLAEPAVLRAVVVAGRDFSPSPTTDQNS